jgi:hypothetical protein
MSQPTPNERESSELSTTELLNQLQRTASINTAWKLSVWVSAGIFASISGLHSNPSHICQDDRVCYFTSLSRNNYFLLPRSIHGAVRAREWPLQLLAKHRRSLPLPYISHAGHPNRWRNEFIVAVRVRIPRCAAGDHLHQISRQTHPTAVMSAYLDDGNAEPGGSCERFLSAHPALRAHVLLHGAARTPPP